MKRSHPSTFSGTLLIVVIAGLALNSIGHARKFLAQNGDKSLDIQRHTNEPLELVDVKVSGHSIKSRVKEKIRRTDGGLDTASFSEAADWPKRLSIRLRNISNKTIVGLQAYLYLKPMGSPVLFGVTLKGSGSLEHTVLQPHDEVEATVDQGSWDRAVIRIKEQGWDANLATVTFTVGIVAFSDGLQWNKGHMLRRDPNNSNMWIPIGKVARGNSEK